jgi:hypothetical protein
MKAGPLWPAVAILASLLVATACHSRGSPSPGSSVASVAAPMSPSVGASLPQGTACRESPIPEGRYATTIRPHDLAKLPPTLAPVGSFFLGRWEIGVGVADPNCYYTEWAVQQVGGVVGLVDAHPFTVIAPNEIAFHGAQEPLGTYRVFVNVKGTVLRFREIHDPSTGRPQALTIGGPWILQRPES